MFRKLAKQNKAISEEACIELLKNQKRGVLSVLGDDDYPYGTPLNHFYDEESGKIYFHSGKIGHRIDAMRACDKVSYCVYREAYKEPDFWALNFHCVHVFGRVEFIEDVEKIEDICRKLSHKFTDDEAYIDDEVKKALKGTICYAITIENMTGKKINEA
jgi:nitroimidazol reductase NimA-like FMN-containing flavoprotein (pyridoxamine 5'-phosphate oxidase superfamily)